MQKIVNGIAKLPEILKELGCRKLFLVIDSSYPFLNIKDAIEALPVEEKVKFSDFTPNPLYEQVCKGIELLKSSTCDAILAVGGGSAIDVAKCIKLAVLAEEGDAAIIPPLVSQRLPIDGSKIPFIAIPTTAGTGSESTHNAVMYYEGAKQTVTNDGILPDYAVLEPSVLKTLPLYQKKCTMMDALCQGIESWWSINSTDESKAYSKKTVELIMANWRKYIFENDDEAAAQIMLAANYGGRAINIAQTTAAHAMSYKITSMYNLPHGHAVALGLPVIWEYMLGNTDKCIDIRGQEYLTDVFKQIAQAMGSNTPIEAVSLFRQMMEEIGLKNPVSENRDEDLTVLSASANPVRLKNNPIELDPDTVYHLNSLIVKEPSKIKVTIAVAVYNVEKFIEKCICSALNQDFDNYEILVVDDRGQDDSIEIVKRIASSHPNGDKLRIYRHEKNSGTGGVRNTCIKEARGEYIFFMDGDDYLAENSIRLLYDAMMEKNADIVMGNHQRVFSDGRIERTSKYKPGYLSSDYAIAQWMKENNTNYYPVALWNKLFKTSFLRDNGFTCVSWHRQEDIYFSLQTAFVVKSIVTIPEVTYYWVQVDGSCTHSEATEWHLKQYLDIFDKSISLYNEKERQITGRYPKELYWIITNRYFWGFVTQNVCSSSLLSKSQKNSYLKHIREITNHIKLSDEYAFWQKMVYCVIISPFPYPLFNLCLKFGSIYYKLRNTFNLF